MKKERLTLDEIEARKWYENLQNRFKAHNIKDTYYAWTNLVMKEEKFAHYKTCASCGRRGIPMGHYMLCYVCHHKKHDDHTPEALISGY